MSEPDAKVRHTEDASIRRSTFSTFVVMISTLGSRILGFVRVAVVGAFFGGSGEADVLNLVFNIPNNLRKLLAEGALSSAFIPVLSERIVRDPDGDSAEKLVSKIITFQFVILIPVLAVSVFFSPSIVRFILDFPEPERQILAARLFRFLIHYILLISISAVMMGTLNSHSRFFIPAVAPLLFSISVITAIVTLHETLGIFSMAVGVLIGGAGQILFQAPVFYRLGYRFTPSFRFMTPEFKKVIRQWLPVVGAASIFTIGQQVTLFFASGLEDGSGSAITNALTFWQLPFGIFSASITTVLFPRMSRQVIEQNTSGLKESLEYGLRYLFTLLVPSAILLVLLGRELIAVALQRGLFRPQYTILASRVLVGYSLGLFSAGAYNFLQRFFYAVNDFRTPALVAFVTFLVDVTLAYRLKEAGLRVAGLSVANSVAFSVGMVILLWRTRRYRLGIQIFPLVVTAVKVLVSVIPVIGFVRIYMAYTGSWWMDGATTANFGRLFIAGTGSLVILAGMYYVLKVELAYNLFRKRKSL
jgi:putative peptidoglycan lipid II flippase